MIDNDNETPSTFPSAEHRDRRRRVEPEVTFTNLESPVLPIFLGRKLQ